MTTNSKVAELASRLSRFDAWEISPFLYVRDPSLEVRSRVLSNRLIAIIRPPTDYLPRWKVTVFPTGQAGRCVTPTDELGVEKALILAFS